jgi:hypothetical protein
MVWNLAGITSKCISIRSAYPLFDDIDCIVFIPFHLIGSSVNKLYQHRILLFPDPIGFLLLMQPHNVSLPSPPHVTQPMRKCLNLVQFGSVSIITTPDSHFLIDILLLASQHSIATSFSPFDITRAQVPASISLGFS